MADTLRIAKDLLLPVDAVTQTYLIVGKRGSGKSNTAARFVEQLHRAGIPFVVLDPVDTWWGLKASRDGTGPGLAGVYVFGGRKQDVPLDAAKGAEVAEVLCEHRLSMVLSVKHLSGRARSTFMVDFARTLFQKWNGGPLHVVLEEAHELAPQSSMNAREGEQEMLGAFKRLWKLGRSSGIGGSAITQRPASLSKDITTQSEILIAHRTIGPQDVKAIGEWVKYHGEHEDILADLPSLPSGEAFVWAPEFPEGEPIGLKRTKILLRDTYDSASTPKVGEHRVEPKELAPVDMERLRAKMAATIEKAKADDPKSLRARIAELEAQLQEQTAADDWGHTDEDLESARDGARADEASRYNAHRQALLTAVRAAIANAQTTISMVTDHLEELVTSLQAVELEQLGGDDSGESVAPDPAPVTIALIPPQRATIRPIRATPAPIGATNGMKPETNGALSGPMRKVLTSVRQLEVLGVWKPSLIQVALFTGVSHTTGSYQQNVRDLVGDGYLIRETGRVSLTDQGRVSSDNVVTPTRAQLLDFWTNKLPGPQAAQLRHIAHYKTIGRDELAGMLNLSPTTGSFQQNLRDLRKFGLIDFKRGEIALTDLLFPKGVR